MESKLEVHLGKMFSNLEMYKGFKIYSCTNELSQSSKHRIMSDSETKALSALLQITLILLSLKKKITKLKLWTRRRKSNLKTLMDTKMTLEKINLN